MQCRSNEFARIHKRIYLLSTISSLPERKPTLLYQSTANWFYLVSLLATDGGLCQIQDILSTKYRKKYSSKLLYLLRELFKQYYKIQFLFQYASFHLYTD